jgi:putative aminopeptidase FrvX
MSASNIKTKSKFKYPKMPKDLKQDFFEILSIPSVSSNESLMTHYIYNWLQKRNINYTVDFSGNIYIVKGYDALSYPCIVSHLDTVHDILSMKIDIEEYVGMDNHNMVTSRHGIGGDDKCGIFACLYLLEKLPNLKVVFFSKEEAGLEGSSQCDTEFFIDVGYIIQLDRWGNSDFISKYYGENTVSKLFQKTADKVLPRYGYTIAEGLITDSINLWLANIGVSCVNISCGYYKHHTIREYIDLNEFYNSLLFTKHLFYELGEFVYESGGYHKKKYSYDIYKDNYLCSSEEDFPIKDNDYLEDVYNEVFKNI